MQRRFVFLNCLVRVFALTMPVQAQTVKLNLHIVLVDRELNQKPVPWFHVTLRREDPQDSEAFDLKTRLDGTCERAVQPGNDRQSYPLTLIRRSFSPSRTSAISTSHCSRGNFSPHSINRTLFSERRSSSPSVSNSRGVSMR